MLSNSRDAYLREFIVDSMGLPEGGHIPLDAVGDSDSFAKCLSGQAYDLLKSDPGRPIVDLFLVELRERLQEEAAASHQPLVYKWFWPEGKRYAVCLTHDADKLSESLSHIWKVRRRFSLPTLLGAFLGIANPFLNLERIATLENAYSLRSSFYLRTKSYDLRKISSTLTELIRRGWEVGLHFDDTTSLEELKLQTGHLEAVVGQGVRGNRSHYLKFGYPETWEILDAAGYLYDTTCGFRDDVGFRVGTCLPYHPPDRHWNRLRLLELPLVLMDTTLWGYKRLTEEEGLRWFEKALNAVSSVNGLFTILWHQCALRMRGGRIYGDILDRLSGEDCWIAKALDVASWWTRRESARLRLNRMDGKFRLEVESPLSLEGLCIRIENANVTKHSAEAPVSIRRKDSFSEVVFSGGASASIEIS